MGSVESRQIWPFKIVVVSLSRSKAQSVQFKYKNRFIPFSNRYSRIKDTLKIRNLSTLEDIHLVTSSRIDVCAPHSHNEVPVLQIRLWQNDHEEEGQGKVRGL